MTAIVERGCGFRVMGGVYACLDLGPRGRPVTDFLFDPPLPMDADAMRITPNGVALFESEGAWHIVDWVGETHYPNVADFIEEVRQHGLSRRVQLNVRAGDGNGFAALTKDSTIVLAHARALIKNCDEYAAELRASHPDAKDAWCPTAKDSTHEHTSIAFDGMCARWWWQDVEGGVYDDCAARRIAWDNKQRAMEGAEPLPGPSAMDFRRVDRAFAATRYAAYRRPDDVTPRYGLAAFARFPIGHLAVIADPESGTHDKALEKVAGTGLPVRVEKE